MNFIPSPGLALFLGILVALLFGNPWSHVTKKLTPRLLAFSIVGLGAGMNLGVVIQVGISGFLYTLVGIAGTLLLGHGLGKLLSVPKPTTLLLSAGTAICGGSAIAAVSSVIQPEDEEVSVSLATVFCLNALALFLFPAVGRYLFMGESEFGLWSALAIHDTSSVVGATLGYGPHALTVATSVKLARALWILPLVIGLGLLMRKQGQRKVPWFILGFVAASALVTLVPSLQPAGQLVASVAKAVMSLTLFLIGLGLSAKNVAKVGWRPFALGIVLWVVVGTLTLIAIQSGWIHV